MTTKTKAPKQSKAKPKAVRVPQQSRSRKTKDAIIASATICFEKNGYDNTTTAQIAEHASVAVGTLYGYYRNKREILLEIVELTILPMADVALEELSAAEEDPQKVIREMVDVVFQNRVLRPGMQQILFERSFKDEELRNHLVYLRDKMREAFELFTQTLEARGMLRDIDHKTTSFVVLHAVQWNATQSYIHLNNRQTKATAAATADLICRYLLLD